MPILLYSKESWPCSFESIDTVELEHSSIITYCRMGRHCEHLVGQDQGICTKTPVPNRDAAEWNGGFWGGCIMVMDKWSQSKTPADHDIRMRNKPAWSRPVSHSSSLNLDYCMVEYSFPQYWGSRSSHSSKCLWYLLSRWFGATTFVASFVFY